MIQYKCDKCKKVIDDYVFGLDAYPVNEPNLKIFHTFHLCSTCYANFGLFMLNDSEDSVNFESKNYPQQNCNTCKYMLLRDSDLPCNKCGGIKNGYSKWEAEDNG